MVRGGEVDANLIHPFLLSLYLSFSTVPYVVYGQNDATGLVHDHLWALIERGAGLLQV